LNDMPKKMHLIIDNQTTGIQSLEAVLCRLRFFYSSPSHITLQHSWQGASVVLSYHNNSLPQALRDLFPDVAIDVNKFGSRICMVDWGRTAN
jgi:hypothetical protein